MAREIPIQNGRLETDLDANGHSIKNLPAGFPSSKQDVIVDLQTIRAGAAAGATAVQPSALNGKADLVGGKVPSSQLPSYVDDVIEVANYAALPDEGEQGKIYVTTNDNMTYRWSGTQYVEIASPVSIIDPASATASGSAADALAVKTALAGKVAGLSGSVNLNNGDDVYALLKTVAEQMGLTVVEE